MDFQLTEDQEALRSGTRELLAGRFPRERLRAAADGAGPVVDRGLWRELGAAGFFGLRLPEDEGGVGLGLPEAVLVFEDAGRVLLPGPLVATHLAAGLVEGAASGERIVGMCDAGAKDQLWEHPADCDELIFLGDGGPYGVDASSPAVTTIRSVDPLTPLARVVVPEEGRPLGGDASRLRAEAALLTAAEQLGSAARTVEMAVSYAKERTQFDRPIGSFQAVKHLCAQMLVRAELARSAVYAAAVTREPGDVAAAKLLADEAAVHNARDCLQVHGGMGFTWEADVHLHLKRAWLRERRWQSTAAGEEALAEELLSEGNVAL
ncbi:acyl-CoA dehydrogenase family protein [Streptomyces varsoviensis]|uniref:Acyl-CoA dehydrogenase n=1 Tax=Streptomyces varsoviensis TaxID=67373 RepID=A0ABR5J8F0_9ACTN|nr:acyl-CoA dehydrogenase family protein [Streptomyces varsoviensis]KOG89723.1 acyl-CoA dehydrogenase [Streptomyces varsoviensis]